MSLENSPPNYPVMSQMNPFFNSYAICQKIQRNTVLLFRRKCSKKYSLLSLHGFRLKSCGMCMRVMFIAKRRRGHSITCHEGTDGRWSYSSTHTTTWALGEGWVSTPRPGRFTPGNTRYPLYRKLAGPRGRSGRVRENSPAHRGS